MANSYEVKHTDPSAGSFQVTDETFNTSDTSLTFVGRNKPRYAQYIAENFLHLLENFANSTPPANPVEGQLWYDNAAGINSLKVWSGSNWNPAGSIKKSNIPPESSQLGDLWVNPVTNQLFIYSGVAWDLVGPQFSSGILTGPKAESIPADDLTTHNIVSLFSNNERIGIISDSSFVPKSFISGFSQINRGITLTSNDDTQSKLWGTSYTADNLNYNGDVVSATGFLRSDINSETVGSIRIKSNDGVTIGSDPTSTFTISTASALAKLTLKSSSISKVIDFNFGVINSNDTPTSGLYIKKVENSVYVGLGNNNIDPQSELDVIGNTKISGLLTVSGTTDSTSLTTGSIITAGGLAVALQSNFGNTATFKNGIVLSRSDEGSVMLPAETTDPIFDLGTADRPFRNVYALSFGNANDNIASSQFYGIFNGSFTGNIQGTAVSLKDSKTFQLIGDINSNEVQFNGTNNAIFNTTVGPNFFTSRDPATTTLDTDQLLTFRSSTGVQRITKSKFLSTVPSVPIGAIFPYAGIDEPAGYLLCDGSEVSVKTYKKLFDTIKYSYRDQQLLNGTGTFALPDLRGRFPLGRDNMDNGLTMTSASGSTVSAGTEPPLRVHEVAASKLGGSSGDEAIGAVSPIGATGVKATTTPISGNEQASSIMNPYQTINYIIFTGVF